MPFEVIDRKLSLIGGIEQCVLAKIQENFRFIITSRPINMGKSPRMNSNLNSMNESFGNRTLVINLPALSNRVCPNLKIFDLKISSYFLAQKSVLRDTKYVAGSARVQEVPKKDTGSLGCLWVVGDVEAKMHVSDGISKKFISSSNDLVARPCYSWQLYRKLTPRCDVRMPVLSDFHGVREFKSGSC